MTASPEIVALEVVAPEVVAPEVVAPEVVALETVAPEPVVQQVVQRMAAPEPVVPETVVPEIVVAEMVVPEPVAADLAVPEAAVPVIVAPAEAASEEAAPEDGGPETDLSAERSKLAPCPVRDPVPIEVVRVEPAPADRTAAAAGIERPAAAFVPRQAAELSPAAPVDAPSPLVTESAGQLPPSGPEPEPAFALRLSLEAVSDAGLPELRTRDAMARQSPLPRQATLDSPRNPSPDAKPPDPEVPLPRIELSAPREPEALPDRARVPFPQAGQTGPAPAAAACPEPPAAPPPERPRRGPAAPAVRPAAAGQPPSLETAAGERPPLDAIQAVKAAPDPSRRKADDSAEVESGRSRPVRTAPPAPVRPDTPAPEFPPGESAVPAALARTKAPAAEPAASEPAPAAKSPTEPARKLSLQVAAPQSGRRVAVDLVDRGGKLHVAVRTGSPELAGPLREGLPELVNRLEGAGFGAETWSPGAARDPAGAAEARSPELGLRPPAPEQSPDERDPERQPPVWLEQLRPRKPKHVEESFLWHLKSIR